MTPADAARRRAAAGIALLVSAALAYRLGSPPLLDDPNDAQYAEVAREMLETGEWISPHLNYEIFLNKPPLLYWMIAASYAVLGVHELAARVPGMLVTLLACVLLYRLARELFDPTTGILAVCVYAGMPGTWLEARFVRPDALLTAAVVATLLAFCVVLRTQGRRQLVALCAMQVALAAGVLAKGAVAVLLPALPIAAVLATERRRDVLVHLLAPRGWWLFALLVLPWHLAVALRHPGFAWDYLVNQHFLFFLDQKLPRDSIPVSLLTFWGAFLLRLLPWTLFLPLALVHAGTHLRGRAAHRSQVLALTWAAGVLAFFSAAASRMEHYVLPAVPATALVLADWMRCPAHRGGVWSALRSAHLLVVMLLFAAACWLVPQLLAEVPWLSRAPALPPIARALFGLLAVAAGVALLISRRYPFAVAPLLGGAILIMTPLIHRGLVETAPWNSTARIATLLQAAGAHGGEIVFEAPVEYQHCAGLNFYLRRKVAILRPHGFVEPTYLQPHRDRLFIDRGRLAEMWQRDRVFFVSDPLAPASRRVDEIVPAPFHVIAGTGGRWLISNLPLRAPTAAAQAHR